ncbi:MAG: transposase [Azoarcus sp.]|jgi:transposase|nr:transposase [Azoarcus sp.]
MDDETFAGIDIARESLDFHLRPMGFHCQVSHDEAGMAEIRQRLQDTAPAQVVVAADDGLENRFVQELMARDFPVCIINTRMALDFSSLKGYARKQSGRASMLADLAQTLSPVVRSRLTEAEYERDALISRRCQLATARDEEIQRGHQAAAPRQEETDQVLEGLEREIAAIDGELEKYLQIPADWRVREALLQSIPGIDAFSARAMLIKCPGLGAFDSRQIARRVGVAPGNDAPGNDNKHPGGGRSDARAILYMATLTAMRRNGPIREFAERMKQAGKPDKVALVACMRKLLTIMNVILKHQTPWSDNPAQAPDGQRD